MIVLSETALRSASPRACGLDRGEIPRLSLKAVSDPPAAARAFLLARAIKVFCWGLSGSGGGSNQCAGFFGSV